jgi:hypothetical protein
VVAEPGGEAHAIVALGASIARVSKARRIGVLEPVACGPRLQGLLRAIGRTGHDGASTVPKSGAALGLRSIAKWQEAAA